MASDTQTTRDYRYELVRVVAILFVVAQHCLMKQYTPDGTPLRFFTANLLTDLHFTSIGLYFILSGRFALQRPVEEGKYADYYFKKLVNLVLPVLCYMFLYSAVMLWRETGTLNGLAHRAVADMLYGHNTGTHFWFVYILLGNLVCAPFLARAINGLTQKTATLLVAIGFCYNFASALVPYFFGQPHTWAYPLGQWTAFFIFGGCLDKVVPTKKERNWLIGLGLCGMAISTLKHYCCSYDLFSHDLMPSYTFYTIMVLLALLQVPIKGEKAQKATLFLAKRSFSIYLLHYGINAVLQPHLQLPLPAFASHLVALAVVFGLSLALSYAIDLLVINNLQSACYALRNNLRAKKA